jgi:hypothetical protein
MGNVRSDFHDRTCTFMTQDEIALDNKIPDLPMLIIMDVGPAYPHILELDDNLVRSRVRHPDGAHLHLPEAGHASHSIDHDGLLLYINFIKSLL